MISGIEQIFITKTLLELFDSEKDDINSLETILSFGELVKKNSSDDNAVIYDLTEYVYEQIRCLRGEDGAYDDVDLRKSLDDTVGSVANLLK